MFRFFIVYLSFILFPVLAIATTLDIFSSGQGNAVLVRHHRQSMLIDAGSKEMKFPAAYRSKLDALSELIPYKLRKKQLKTSRTKEEGTLASFTRRTSSAPDPDQDSPENLIW